jgi:hypothetical protein
VNIQQILDQAQNIAKYIEMINNQVQQIQKLTDQLDEFKRYEDLFGDPKAVLLATVKPLTDDLRKTELGQTLSTLEGTVNAGQALLCERPLSKGNVRRSTRNGTTVTSATPCPSPRSEDNGQLPVRLDRRDSTAHRVESRNRRDHRCAQGRED